MFIKPIFLVSLVLHQVFGQDHTIQFSDNTLFGGAQCVNPTGERGICLSLNQCLEPQHQALQRKICGFRRTQAIICCTKYIDLESAIIDKASNRIMDEVEVALGNESCKYNTENPQTKYNLVDWGDASVLFPSETLVSIGWADWRNRIQWKCTGSLIENLYVLVPAHCVSDKGNMPIVIRVGDFRLHVRYNSLMPIYFNITEVHIHPDYKPSNFYHNLAILKLTPWTNTTFSSKPACLWTQNDIPIRYELIAYAYEETVKKGNHPNEPLQAFVNVVDHQKCQEKYRNDAKVPQGLDNNFICVIEEGNFNTLCTTVYGSELMLTTSGSPTERKNFLVGISTFGQLCNKSPRVFTKVAPYMNWISSILWP